MLSSLQSLMQYNAITRKHYGDKQFASNNLRHAIETLETLDLSTYCRVICLCRVQYNADTSRWGKEYNYNRLVSGACRSSSPQHNCMYSSAVSRTNLRHQRSTQQFPKSLNFSLDWNLM